jgi:hypothetical protein
MRRVKGAGVDPEAVDIALLKVHAGLLRFDDIHHRPAATGAHPP